MWQEIPNLRLRKKEMQWGNVIGLDHHKLSEYLRQQAS